MRISSYFCSALNDQDNDMKEFEKNRKYWFVIGSLGMRNEIKICDDMNMAHIECFVPLKYEAKRVRGEQREALVPAVTGLIFVHGTEDEIIDYLPKSPHHLYFKKSAFTNGEEKLTVSEEKMEQFIAFVSESQEHIHYYSPNEIDLKEGESVRVPIGTRLYEGKIVRIKGKRKKLFVVEIPDIALAAIEISPDLIQVKDTQKGVEMVPKEEIPHGKKSKDIDKDKKLLMEMAYRLLFVFPHQEKLVRSVREIQVTQIEVKRAMQRLASFKGVTPALEGELALPMYLGAKAVGSEEEQLKAVARVRSSLNKLKDSSLLKVRIRLFLAVLENDQDELLLIKNQLEEWRKKPLSSKQKEIIDLFSSL